MSKLKLRRVNNFIAISLIIANLAGFNFSIPLVSAEGESAANGTVSQENNTQVATGDANVVVETQNSANINEVNLGENNSPSPSPTVQPEGIPSLSEPEPEIPTPTPIPSPVSTPIQESESISPLVETPASTPVPAEESVPADESGASGEEPAMAEATPAPEGANVQISNNNEAAVKNDIAAEGNSGGNTAGGQGNASIDTGNANVVVGLVNTANTNIINSNFLQFLFNIFKNSGNDIDLSKKIDAAGQKNCSSGGCLGDLNIANNNAGSIENNLSINASSGGNEAVSENGSASIRTGDANAAANIFNFLNTNIVGANWYNLIINIFGDWTGDLVLPGKAKIGEFLNFSGNNAGSCAGNCEVSISNTDEGAIENQVYLNADTGGNQAIGNSTVIRTGNAKAEVNLWNIANTSSVGNNWFFIAVNNLGGWEGQVFSLPPGLNISDDSGDIKIYNVAADNIAGGADAGANSDGQNENSEGGGELVIKNSNSGIIKNSVVINVLTGGNSAFGSDGAAISTGKASALANIINILNSNIIGGNWMLGMINIFGNWKGNLAFGRPDLWIGASAADSLNPPTPGDTITYTLTYANTGDADATGVTLSSNFDKRYFSIVDSGGGGNKDGEIQWNIGNVPVGGTGFVSYSVAVGSEIPYGFTAHVSRTGIASIETDWNSEDNMDEILTEVYKRPFRWMPPSPNLKIKKTRIGEGAVYGGSKVDYRITMTNESDGPALDVSVEDTFFNASGESVSGSNWKLGEVFPREKIIIEYTLSIGSEFPVGSYTSATQAKGFDHYGTPMNYPKVFSTLEIKEREVPAVEEKAIAAEEEAAPELSPAPLPPVFSASETAGIGAIEEIAAKIEKAAENKDKESPAVRKKAAAGSVAGAFQEILGAEASAKEEGNLSPAGGEEGVAALSGGFLPAEGYKDILRILTSFAVVTAGLFVFFKRKKSKEIFKEMILRHFHSR